MLDQRMVQYLRFKCLRHFYILLSLISLAVGESSGFFGFQRSD